MMDATLMELMFYQTSEQTAIYADLIIVSSTLERLQSSGNES
jgi:hypothetical protein